MIYLTYNDPPSGVYFGQVTDVCKFLNKEFNARIRLVALISIRNFFKKKKKIKAELPDAIVLPMFPKVRFWRANKWILFLLLFFLRSNRIIARGPFAALLALDLKKLGVVKKVCFDSRGAVAAEVEECGVIQSLSIRHSIREIEEKAVKQADFRIAVSQKLLDYWREQFSYSEDRHVVIPCTLNTSLSSGTFSEESIKAGRKKLGASESDVLLVYSGSSAKWQSLEEIKEFLKISFPSNPNIKFVLLTAKYPDEFSELQDYRDRIIHLWVEPAEVLPILMSCDYGILLRKNLITNEVASPVKFAEYLAAGLAVVISEKIGDFSGFVSKHQCGYVMASHHSAAFSFSKISFKKKEYYRELALKYFSKDTFYENYAKVLSKFADDAR